MSPMSASTTINQQRYFTTLIITIIGAASFIIAFFVFSWNKRLEALVNTRTVELASANEQLKIHDKMKHDTLEDFFRHTHLDETRRKFLDGLKEGRENSPVMKSEANLHNMKLAVEVIF